MPVIIPDEVLRQAGLSEREALIEIACRLYDAGVLLQPDATRLSGLTRSEFWEALRSRGLPWMHVEELEPEAEFAALQARIRRP